MTSVIDAMLYSRLQSVTRCNIVVASPRQRGQSWASGGTCLHQTQHSPRAIYAYIRGAWACFTTLVALVAKSYIICTAGICARIVHIEVIVPMDTIIHKLNLLAGDKLVKCSTVTSHGWKGRNSRDSTKIQCLPGPTADYYSQNDGHNQRAIDVSSNSHEANS